jgi:hypothetical protein
MKYEVGDKILLLHSKEEGTIVDLLDNGMVMVEVGGATFPVYYDQIDFPYFHRFTEKKLVPPPRRIPGDEIKPLKKQEDFRMDKGVFLSMLPVFVTEGYEENIQLLKFHLLNESQFTYRFTFQVWLANKMDLEIKNEILPFNNFYLSDLLFASLNDNPRFEFTFYLKDPKPDQAVSFQKTWKIKPKQLFQQLTDLRSRADATMSYLLFDKYPDKAPEAPKPVEQPIAPIDKRIRVGSFAALSSKIKLQPDTPMEPKYEVDLHIEKLVDDWYSLSSIAILAIQLNEFQRYLDLAITHHQKSMIIIHGVGTGKLRDEVHGLLKQTPEVESFVNQYHGRYGYGATEIFFKY